MLLIHVAERDDLDRRDLNEPEQIVLAIPAAADESDPLGLLIGDFFGEEFLLSGSGK